MKKKKSIPDEYFDNQEFILNQIDDDLIIGVLGKNPSPNQLLKFELCSYIAHVIDSKGLTLSDVQNITDVNMSDVSRIKNHQLERFTIDRLIKIYSMLDSQCGVGNILATAGEKIRRLSA